MSKIKTPIAADQVELNRRIRRGWGELRPVTRVMDSAKRYTRKDKHRRSVAEMENL